MTSEYIRADPLAWEQAIEELRIAQAALESLAPAAEDAQVDAVHDRFDHAKDKVLELPAPDVEAIIAKLHILFAEEIGSDLAIYDAHRKVIGDLRRVIQSRG